MSSRFVSYSLLLPLAGLVGCFSPDPVADTDQTSGGTSSTTAPGSETSSAPTSQSTGSSTTADETSSPTTVGTDPTTGSPTTTEAPTSTSTTGDDTEASSSSESSTTGPMPCNPQLDDCGPGQFCNAPDCDTLGECAPSPMSTDNAYAPACGCNGVNYWNVQHANWLGVAAEANPLGCAELNCDSDADCPEGTECTIDYGPQGCGMPAQGQCYGIPAAADCEGTPKSPVGFGGCVNGPFSCSDGYLNLCEALLEREFYVTCI